jgi:LysM repeat protein
MMRRSASYLCALYARCGTVLLLLVLVLLTACQRPEPQVTISATLAPLVPPPTPPITPLPAAALGGENVQIPPTPEIQPTPSLAPQPATPQPQLPPYEGTPTPDPTQGYVGGELLLSHTVAPGETLVSIAQRYGTEPEELIQMNGLEDGDFLFAGQVLQVPGGATILSPSFKIIPDSELVYGPAAADFDVAATVASYGGYLASYQEAVEGQMLSGAQIVQLLADRFSVNPRLLLAALEFRAGWLTRPAPPQVDYPMGKTDVRYEGLYAQLRWAADQINMGYYGHAEGGLTTFEVGGTRVAFAPDLNSGSTGIQYWLAAHDGASYETWLQEIGPSGFFATFSRLFGNPFAYTVDPLWPVDLQQPPFRLPWAVGETWYFTGGPHGGWASGSAWAALDFVPDHDQLGCYQTDAWVRAMAPGLVSRSGFGAVVVDLDGDGFAGTGWAVTYMHLESRDRAPEGTQVDVGDPLGHPSCEGGFSNGTHVHISRTFNGRWISADGALPFAMSGWVSQGLGREYDGLLVRDGVTKEACECRDEVNAITAD